MSTLPRPLYDTWPAAQQPAATALWAWHSALARPQAVGGDGAFGFDDHFFADEAERAAAGDALQLLPAGVAQPAYEACAAHGLDRALLARQVRAARHLHGRTRFATAADLNAFVHDWAVAHGHLLAGLAGHKRFARNPVAELSRGFFLLGRLLQLPDDLDDDRLFIPEAELDQHGVRDVRLVDGRMNEDVRRLLWKQSVRIRDALGQGQLVLRDVDWRLRFHLKRYWLGALAHLDALEAAGFDVWAYRPLLPWYQHVQIHVQAFFGRALST
ncbi:squalene/phytoene synthase family protein [Salisaeta longa]|uniref:squalene/phytoene synthase family protein n=1 Tax=Salisaeta longa TaxID=503170 RepID=UPI0003B4E90D|nr:squalene/phytoene synthase family protein [Salisaeta longa]